MPRGIRQSFHAGLGHEPPRGVEDFEAVLDQIRKTAVDLGIDIPRGEEKKQQAHHTQRPISGAMLLAYK